MTAAVAAPAEPGRRRFSVVLFLLPILLLNAVVFFWPIVNLFKMSFIRIEGTGALTNDTTLANWAEMLTDSFYAELLWESVSTSVMITLLTLVLSYPIALYLHRSTGLWRTILLVLVISPLLTSAVVRTYGWIAILADGGMINSILAGIGLPPQRLIFNKLGVVVGLTEILMPYMILALLAGFGKLDHRLEEAAATLGARPWKSFVRVVLPLSLPGILLGCLLTFVLAVSSFITPKLLGGGRVFLLATEIYDQAIVTLNWPRAATLSIIILVVFGLALAVYARTTRE